MSNNFLFKIRLCSKTFEREGFETLVHQIAESKKTDYNAIVTKMSSVSGPSLAGTTGVANKANVDRMTDTSKYTGLYLQINSLIET